MGLESTARTGLARIVVQCRLAIIGRMPYPHSIQSPFLAASLHNQGRGDGLVQHGLSTASPIRPCGLRRAAADKR